MFTSRHPMFLPHFQCLEVTVLLLLKATQVTPGGDQALLVPLRDRPNIWTRVLISLAGGAPLTGPAPLWVPLCIPDPHPSSPGRQVPPPDQTVCWHLVGVTSPSSLGDAPHDKGGEKTPSPNPMSGGGQEPPEMLNRGMGHRGISTESNIDVPAQTQWICVQRLSPKNKGDLLYIPM
jgi:hypothetical protein